MWCWIYAVWQIMQRNQTSYDAFACSDYEWWRGFDRPTSPHSGDKDQGNTHGHHRNRRL